MESKIGKKYGGRRLWNSVIKKSEHRSVMVCHKMWQLGWVASNDGNVSVKLSDGTFLATPTGVSKSMVTPGNDRAYK